MLKMKYGEPSNNITSIFQSLYTEADEVYQCLKYPGCGTIATYWVNKEGIPNISIELQGLSRGQGFIRLVYESPNWDSIVDKNTDAVNQQTEDAL